MKTAVITVPAAEVKAPEQIQPKPAPVVPPKPVVAAKPAITEAKLIHEWISDVYHITNDASKISNKVAYG